MSRICPSCGGIVGRDCFNPVECAHITEMQNQQHDKDHYQQGYDLGYYEGSAKCSEMHNALKKIYDECHKILLRGTEITLTTEELKTFVGAVAETVSIDLLKANY